jgi:hypothetical protein
MPIKTFIMKGRGDTPMCPFNLANRLLAPQEQENLLI